MGNLGDAVPALEAQLKNLSFDSEDTDFDEDFDDDPFFNLDEEASVSEKSKSNADIDFKTQDDQSIDSSKLDEQITKLKQELMDDLEANGQLPDKPADLKIKIVAVAHDDGGNSAQ